MFPFSLYVTAYIELQVVKYGDCLKLYSVSKCLPGHLQLLEIFTCHA